MAPQLPLFLFHTEHLVQRVPYSTKQTCESSFDLLILCCCSSIKVVLVGCRGVSWESSVFQLVLNECFQGDVVSKLVYSGGACGRHKTLGISRSLINDVQRVEQRNTLQSSQKACSIIQGQHLLDLRDKHNKILTSAFPSNKEVKVKEIYSSPRESTVVFGYRRQKHNSLYPCEF